MTKYKYKKVNFLDISDRYDVIISINTLEHVKLKNLIEIFNKIKSTLNTNSLSLHIIDHNDHFEYVDKKITRLNMHKFSNFLWEHIITSYFNYTNRLTIEDYKFILTKLNISFEILPLFFHDNRVVDNFLIKYLFANKKGIEISHSLLKVIKR
ncbi:MAG: class I SAM-dependent methyltransferase [Patescibacteria group bacterium]|nr:class I SAM-dependent methyltransferase [Patescibacteria group bacterium]